MSYLHHCRGSSIFHSPAILKVVHTPPSKCSHFQCLHQFHIPSFPLGHPVSAQQLDTMQPQKAAASAVLYLGLQCAHIYLLSARYLVIAQRVDQIIPKPADFIPWLVSPWRYSFGSLSSTQWLIFMEHTGISYLWNCQPSIKPGQQVQKLLVGVRQCDHTHFVS